MEQHTHGTHDTHVENKPGYWPMIVIVAVLGLLAWVLLHHYNRETGYLWQGSLPKMEHEGREGHPESHHGGESHGGPGSIQEPEHGGEMNHGNAAGGHLDSLTGNFIKAPGAADSLKGKDSAATGHHH